MRRYVEVGSVKRVLTMRLLVCGGRHYSDVAFIWRSLDAVHAKRRIGQLMEGASDDVTGPYIGADYWANQWALARGVPPLRFRADWKGEGRAAGPLRNGKMISEGNPHG